MAEPMDNSNEEYNLTTKGNIKLSESILEDYIIPKRLIYANSLIKSLKDKKYKWEIEGKKVIKFYKSLIKILSETSGTLTKEQKRIIKFLLLTNNSNEYRREASLL